MSDIRGWLEEHGLDQYADTFEENEIDRALLRELNDGDLEKLGVSIMGHRKRLLKAVADGIDNEPTPEKLTPEQDLLDQPALLAAEAERRQITVMFCDLVGSTELSGKLDPEDLREVMASYQKAASTVIEHYEGHVAQYLGDGLMIYFGWPQAHEDDAQRAIRAGLEIIEAVNGLATSVDLSIRIGVATGAVVVGDSRGDNRDDAKLAVGETPNLAARIQGVAAADTVLIGEATRRLIGGTFELDELGPQDLKGIDTATIVYRVMGEAAAESRFAASHDALLTPLVGREHETGLLIDRWEQAKDGEGQVVLLSGEAGIGKSRITQELRVRLTNEPHTRLSYQCSPYHTNSAFHPIIDQLERAAGFARDDRPETKLDKLEAVLGQSGSDTALIAALLSLPIERYPLLNLSPQKQKEITIAALARHVAAWAASKPVLMIFEDAHWIDPTSLETVGAVIEAVRDHPVLLVITFRPEFEPPWVGHAHVTPLTLGRLGRKLGAGMVAKLTDGKALPDEVLDQIVAKTDGIPLFVEELTKTVLEAGFLKEQDDRYTLDGELPPLAIPATLQDSLMARLDRLAPVREVAQIGACIGREFSYELLAAVSPLREDELQDSLTQLVNSELIFRRGAGAHATYTFKHALVQDAAYESLLKSHRQQLHTTIGRALDQHFSDLVEAEPELAAHHYTEAGLRDSAVKHWLAAGQKALARSANAEASAHLRNGLDCLATLPDNRERDEQELTLQTLLGFALINFRGYGAPESGQAYSRASELCQRLGDSKHLAPILLGLWTYHIARSDFAAAGEMVELCFAVGQDEDDPAVVMIGHALGCGTTLYLGDAVTSLDHAEKGLALYDPDTHTDLARRFGFDVGPMCPDWGSMALWLLGHPDRAAESNRQGLILAEATGHPLSYATVLSHTAVYHWLRRDIAAVQTQAEATIALSQEVGIPFRYIEGLITKGWALAAAGEVQQGSSMIRDGIEKWHAIEATRGMPVWLTMLAQAERHSGDTDSALVTLEKAFAALERTGECIWEPEMCRLNGVFLLDRGERHSRDAEACFEKAITIAQFQSTRSWELRAATSLAKLWQSQGKAREARDLLGPVYGWFTEGLDTSDLKDAKTLLEELN
jgi:class 3 adenylate cyclase/predicted ATPase